MRPKIVILTLLAAFVGLGIMALLKGMAEKKADAGGAQLPVAGQASAVPSNNPVASISSSSNTTAESQQLHDAIVGQQIGEIQSLLAQADSSNNATIIAGILDKLNHSEVEVRAAALDALKQLNDTNAIPGLQSAANSMSNPREKVSVLDVIDYLRLPNITDDAPSGIVTNYAMMNFLATNAVHSPHGRPGVHPAHKINGQANASSDGTGQPQPQ